MQYRLKGIPHTKTAFVEEKGNFTYAGKGRPASIDAAHVHEMKAQDLGATGIAKALGIGWVSVYRVLEAG
jgi:hypothetical protein